MSWQDTDQDDHGHDEDGWHSLSRPGGDWQGMRPSFDNPMTWSLPLGRVAGLRIRAHIILLAFIIITLLRPLFPPDAGDDLSHLGFDIVLIGLACLLVLLLMHEFGHALACRWSGGHADEILLWPVGGLAYCRPSNRWASYFFTALGGPAVNLLFVLVAGIMLGLATGHWLGVALPNPLLPPDKAFQQYGIDGSWGLMVLYLTNWISFVLLLINLLPVFPLDGGRLLQAALWRRMGYVPSMRVTVRVGYVGAIGLGLLGAVLGNWLLLGVAVFGGINCFLTYRQMEYTESTLGGAADAYGQDLFAGDDGAAGSTAEPSTSEDQRSEKQASREEQAAQQVDEILSKIARSGIDSLTKKERRLLQRTTEKKRQQE